MMIKLLPHAERQLIERDIELKEVEDVVAAPDQVLDTDIMNRKVAQKILTRDGIKFLYRVIYTKENADEFIITAYRTTKINKYWKGEQK